MYKSGFTLIELLAVIAIVGMLIIAGYPSYQSYLREARRQEAIQEIMKLQIVVEDHLAKNNALPTPSGTYDPITNPLPQHDTINNLYTVTYTLATTTYTIVAVAKTGTTQANDTGCTTLTLDSTIDGITPYECK